MKKTIGLLLCAAAALSLCAKDYKTLPMDKANKITVNAPSVPDKVGEAEVCLWKNDAIGAATFTVDDNCAPDWDWWAETAKKYDAHITWFLIAERIGGPNAFNGTWPRMKKLLDAGHDAQSHTYTHFHDDNMSITDEYRVSKETIEKNLPGHKVLAIAYPGGKKSSKNSKEEAAKIYCMARGVTGGTNVPGKIDYLSTKNAGISLDESNERTGTIYMTKVAADKRYKQNYRAWYCHLYHFFDPKKPQHKETVLKAFEFYKEKGVWLPTYVNASKYSQERDSATLTKVKGAGNEYVFKLTDLMDDSIYDYPLTLKFRTPDDWQKVKVTQNGKSAEYEVKTWEGSKKYVMFDAVPDRGDIQIVKVK